MSVRQPGRRYKAIFLDLFGTLVSHTSNEESHLRLMEDLVDRYNITTEPPVLLKRFNDLLQAPYMGTDTTWVPHRELVVRALDEMLKDHGLVATAEAEGQFYERYLSKHRGFVRLLPGAREAVESLQATRLLIGAVADCDRDYLDQQLRWLEITELFDSQTTAEEAGARKPDGKLFLAALEKAHCRPEQAVFAGDSVERDIRGAKALGMTTVLLDARMVYTELEEADFVASHLSRMATILMELAYSP